MRFSNNTSARPVYIQISVDLVAVSVSTERIKIMVTLPESLSYSPEQEQNIVGRILERILSAKCPVVLADGKMHPLDIIEEVQAFVDATHWPTWTKPIGKGLLDETRSDLHGINWGKFDAVKTQEFISKADLVLKFGLHYSLTNTYGFFDIPDNAITISFSHNGIKIVNDLFRDLSATHVLSQLNDNVDLSKVKPNESYPDLPRDHTLYMSNVPADNHITQDKL